MKILIADDEEVTRILLSAALKELEYQVYEAHDGEQALKLLSTHKDIHMCVVDWNMPKVNGLEICKTLREKDDRFYYIIMLTGHKGSEATVTAMEAGADDFISKPVSPAELQARVNSGLRIVSLTKKLSFYAEHDSLTGLFNRRIILQQLDAEWARAERKKTDLSLLVLDIDHFKSVNDNYGHDVGDQALVHFCEIIKQATREYDSIGRFGGEEFLIVMPETHQNNAIQVAERIRMTVEKSPLNLNSGKELKMTTSIGVAIRDQQDAKDSVTKLFKRADNALYQAKEQGRNQVVTSTGSS